MNFSTISSKGQITLPMKVRKALGLMPHDRVQIVARENEIVIKPAVGIAAYEGFLGKRIKNEHELMLDAVADHALGKD